MYHSEITVILYPIQYKFKKPNEKYHRHKYNNLCILKNLKKNVSDISIGLAFIVLYYKHGCCRRTRSTLHIFRIQYFYDPYKVDAIVLNKL